MAFKYIKYFPKPVLDDLLRGRWLSILGSGMSLNAVTPIDKRMPLWRDLGDSLTSELDDFSPTSTLDSISAYEHEFGRTRLIERLSEILLVGNSKPGIAHKAFCEIPFDLVCTTNFDFLLERQYELTPRYVYPVVDEEQLSVGNETGGTILLKLHGDLRHPSRLIVSEGDYDAFLNRFPLLATYLANLLITKTAIFIGYSLDDPDFRQIWHIVSNRLGRNRRKAYTIGVGVRPADAARYERRGVKVINLPGSHEKYGEILAAAFVELHRYMLENVISVSKVTEERPLQQLSLPRDASTNLCFFSLALERLPFYRERVFPIVEEVGLVPVTADDVITPGDNFNAKIASLIDRASVMVAEITSSATSAELRMALAREKGRPGSVDRSRPFRLILIVTDIEQIPPYAPEVLYIERPNKTEEDSESFISTLRKLLVTIVEKDGLQRTAEPSRLLAAREYRAAVISAMALLEVTLRKQLSKDSLGSSRDIRSMRYLVDTAIDQRIIDELFAGNVRKWMKLRNDAVHSGASISKGTAIEVVNGVLNWISQQ